MKPLLIGTVYDGHEIVDIVDYDPRDSDYQPYLYQLDDGSTVWIPLDQYDELSPTPTGQP